jgi:hypothetical protein
MGNSLSLALVPDECAVTRCCLLLVLLRFYAVYPAIFAEKSSEVVPMVKRPIVLCVIFRIDKSY